ncbi:NAD(P)H-dependent oxidoreductase [Microbacterium sp. SS28]|uniref:NAD(P)H-dependent oxidoreductase n=1 Tax=Microbacterium sp. SS28 TaxID=2919948 RepID=UPI001FA95280|nr:NAD(P)H-dependent oxidoreductase [Microbacterium sp. SS28]
MNPRILVIVGTPITGSLNHSLATAYVDDARAGGADVRVIDLANDPIPGHPTHRDELRMPRTDDDTPLDADVAAYIEDVRWADHIVFFHPQWWGTYPAALKAFIDRVFLSGFAFRYRAKSALSERLLAGRTARIVMTMDSPRLWNRLAYRNAAETSLKRAILGYCGVKTVGVTRFTPVRFSEDEQRSGWVAEAGRLGRRDAAASVTRSREAVAVA